MGGLISQLPASKSGLEIFMDSIHLRYKAELVAIGFLYEEHAAPLTDEQIDIAKRLIAEREQRQTKKTS